MKIIEQGKKIETKASEKTFKCTCCNCKRVFARLRKE